MGNSSSSHKISAQDKAILDLKLQRDKIKQYQKRLHPVIKRETDVARACLAAGNKSAALTALRKKKYQESLLQKTNAQLEQLEGLTGNVEFALVQRDVLYGIAQGTEVLKVLNREVGGVEGVEKLMGEGEEARRVQVEISEALAGHMTNADEDEVEDELEAMEREVNGVTLPDAPSKTVVGEGTLPEVPVGVLDQQEKEKRQKEKAKARRVALEA